MNLKQNEINDVLELLFNQILFGCTKEPIFNTGKTKFSSEFLSHYEDYKKTSDANKIEDYILNQIGLVIQNLEFINKEKIVNFILKDDNFLATMSLLAFGNIKNLTEEDAPKVHDKITTEIKEFVFNSEENKFIVRYFELFFINLFEYEFENNTVILEDEYLRLKNQFTNKKEIYSVC